MDQTLKSKLDNLPPLTPQRAGGQERKCKICGNGCYFFDAVDFNKCCSLELYPYDPSGVTAEYYKCGVCGFIFTSLCDDWQSESFSKYIYNDDYIKVDGEYKEVRPARLAAEMTDLFVRLKDKRILDYGSGSAFFATAMQKSGFSTIDVYDPFSSPRRPQGLFDVITCFEVIEHTVDPITTLRDMKGLLDPNGIILLSTGIQPEDIDTIRANWWYVGPRNGHISIFTDQALAIAAEKAGLQLYHDHVGRQWLAGAGQTQLFATIGIEPYSVHTVELRASEESHVGWHGIETIGDRRMRWTAHANVCWAVSYARPCLLIIQIPVLMYIDETFVKNSRIEVDAQAYGLTYSRGFLKTRAHLMAPPTNILELTLATPLPLRPCDMCESPDRRLLGLAIEI